MNQEMHVHRVNPLFHGIYRHEEKYRISSALSFEVNLSRYGMKAIVCDVHLSDKNMCVCVCVCVCRMMVVRSEAKQSHAQPNVKE